MKLLFITVLCIFYNFYGEVVGHGSMTEPPARTAAWRQGFNTPTDYKDMEVFCGGFAKQWTKDGKLNCGVCGDEVPANPQIYECPNGEYCKKVIVRNYKAGQTVDITINFAANHGGNFVFRICPVTDENKEVTWDCLKQHELIVTESGSTVWIDPYHDGGYNGDQKLHVKLPAGLTCKRCVLQWHWTGGNRWGTCANGTQAGGCGPQETFINCADVSIA